MTVEYLKKIVEIRRRNIHRELEKAKELHLALKRSSYRLKIALTGVFFSCNYHRLTVSVIKLSIFRDPYFRLYFYCISLLCAVEASSLTKLDVNVHFWVFVCQQLC